MLQAESRQAPPSLSCRTDPPDSSSSGPAANQKGVVESALTWERRDTDEVEQNAAGGAPQLHSNLISRF